MGCEVWGFIGISLEVEGTMKRLEIFDILPEASSEADKNEIGEIAYFI